MVSILRSVYRWVSTYCDIVSAVTLAAQRRGKLPKA